MPNFKNLVTALFILTCTFIFAQQKEYREAKIDSLTFINTRKQLENVNTSLFEKRLFSKDSIRIPFGFLTPKDNQTGKKFPLIITFHNSTRIGNDNEKQLEPLAKIWLRDEIYANYQCYVVAPQFNKRSSNYVPTNDNHLTSKPSNEVSALLTLIENLQKEYPNIDKNRIYLIGYSMGASTAQNLLSLKPNKFAALVSVAAVPDFSNLKKIENKNIWLIHGDQDDENPYDGSVVFFDKLAKSKNLTFTTVRNLNHNTILSPFLTTDEIPQWLFAKEK
ncbi:phospholipase [Flavobacterium faecale]|uniref:Phospholipase n=2 Tax=Flavobacterium faecale TaxID=1355330 RepID=A0A2S1LIU5_9FLAO|nr:phospholipase [Flavobacterium faecale]